jgi:hypothetical protein
MLVWPNSCGVALGRYAAIEQAGVLSRLLCLTLSLRRLHGVVVAAYVELLVLQADPLDYYHGASPTTAMTHIAIQVALEGKAVDWIEKVTGERYQAGSRTV